MQQPLATLPHHAEGTTQRHEAIAATSADDFRAPRASPLIGLVEMACVTDASVAGAVWHTIASLCCDGAEGAARHRALFTAETHALRAAAATLRREDVHHACLSACLFAVASMCGGVSRDSSHDASIAEAVGVGMATAIVTTMQRPASGSGAEVLLRACEALSRLARTESAKAAVVDARGVEAIVAASRRVGVHLRRQCVDALAELFSDASWSAIARAASLSVVLPVATRSSSARDAHHGDSEWSTWMLPLVSVNRDEHAIDAVVATMQRHRDAAYVQVNGCRALRELDVDAGGVAVAAVVEAMRRHEDVADVQAAGCEAVAAVVCMCAQRVPADLPREVLTASINAVVTAMRRHDSDGVQEWGCHALRNLCDYFCDTDVESEAVRASEAAAAGGLEAVMAVIDAHPEWVEHCTIAFMYLRAAASEADVLRAGGEEAVQRCMETLTRPLL